MSDLASLLEKVAALDDASPNEEIGGFVGDGSWRSLGTVAEIRRFAAALSPPIKAGEAVPERVTEIIVEPFTDSVVLLLTGDGETLSAICDVACATELRDKLSAALASPHQPEAYRPIRGSHPMTHSSTDSSLVERLREGVPLTEVDGREVADTDAADATMEWAANVILSLTAQRDDFRAKVARMGEALAWSMDEIDILSNKMSGFAYPQGMVPARRRDQLDNYRKAVDARRSALQSEKDREGEDGR